MLTRPKDTDSSVVAQITVTSSWHGKIVDVTFVEVDLCQQTFNPFNPEVITMTIRGKRNADSKEQASS